MNMILLALVFALPAIQDETRKTDPEPTFTADSVWTKIEPENIGAAFEMPKQPEYSMFKFDDVVKTPLVVHQYKTIVNDGKASFAFVFNDLDPKMDDNKTIKNTLDYAVQGANARVLGSLKSVKSVRHGRHPGREFVYVANLNGTVFKFSTKIVLVGQRLYQLNLVMTDKDYDERMSRKFFDSFKLVKRDVDLPPKPRKAKSSKP